MKCENCGTELKDSYNYCPVCGNNINEQKVDTLTHKKKKWPLTTIIMSFLIIVFCTITLYFIFEENNFNYTVKGDWSCSVYSQNMSNDDLNYNIEMYFRDDNTFKINSDNLSIEGKYSEEKIDKKIEENSSIVEYSNVAMESELMILDGVVSKNDSTTNYEFGFFRDKKNALVINTGSYSMYLCKK